MELDMLMDQIDADGSGEVEPDELFGWLFSAEDNWLEDVPRRERDDLLRDTALLRRDSTRFDPVVRCLLDGFWKVRAPRGTARAERDRARPRIPLSLSLSPVRERARPREPARRALGRHASLALTKKRTPRVTPPRPPSPVSPRRRSSLDLSRAHSRPSLRARLPRTRAARHARSSSTATATA